MNANLMDLVRELKDLNGRKKAGEVLSDAEEARRKELKVYLRSALESQGAGGSQLEESAIREAPPVAGSGPKPVPMAVAERSAGRPAERPAERPAAPAPAAVPLSAVVPSPAPSVRAPAPAPAPSAAPKPFVPKKDFFAIDAGSVLDEAANSEAVAKVDTSLANRKARASQAEIEESEARADAAIRSTKKKERATTPEEVLKQLKETQATYTPPEESYVLEQYYGDFALEGYQAIDVRDAGDLKVIDPREIEIAKLDMAGGPSAGAVTVTIPPGLAFLDDFSVLYAKKILPSPEEEVIVDSVDPDLLIPGKRKVTVHLLNGEKKQGAIRTLRRGDLGFKLEPIGSGQTEELSISQVKAVFIHLQPNQSPKDGGGRSVTATFSDGRAIQGTSDDYQPGSPVFTLVPPAGRGQFERIIVNGAAVQSVR